MDEQANILFFLKPKLEVAYLYHDQSLRQGLEKMRAHGYTAIPVLYRDGSYAGAVSEGDFLWNILKTKPRDSGDLEDRTVGDLVRRQWIPPVRIDATMDDLLLRVIDQNFVPVVDGRNLFMGIVTRREIIKYFYERA